MIGHPGRDALAGYLAELDALADQDEAAAERRGAELTELAERLPRSRRRLLLAGIDLIIAEMVVGGPRWPEAAHRLRRSRTDIERELPGMAVELESVLARLAVREGRRDDAGGHWTRARELAERAAEWGQAGAAAAALAELVEDDGDTATAEALYRTAAGQLARADAPEAARECAGRACQLVLRRVRAEMRPGEEGACLELVTAAREFGLRHGVDEPAAELACFAGLMGSETPCSWDEVAGWFTLARREYRALTGMDPRALRINLAWVDCCEGRAALGRHRGLSAEPLLRAALEVYRQEGMTEAAELCEVQLVATLSLTEPDLERPARAAVNQRWTDVDAVFAATTVRALSMLSQGRYAEASELLEQAQRAAVAAGTPHKAVMLSAYPAVVALAQGDTGAARRAIIEIERCRTEGAARLPHTETELLGYVALTLRAMLAEATGDHRRSQAHLTRLESWLLANGSGALAAQLAVRRAHAQLRDGQPATAMRTVLPAVLALDAVRFSLPDSDRRRRWAATVALGFDVAFRAAAAVGDTTLIAELIEVARGNAVPLPRDGDSDAVAALGDLLTPPGDPATPQPSGAVLSGAQVIAGGEHRTALGLPALTRTPWRTIALGEHLERALTYHSPARADTVVDWHVVPGCSGHIEEGRT